MADPINRTILLIDVERFSRRVDRDQAVIRRVLYAVLNETLAAASIDPTECRSEDRGDEAFVLIDASVPKPQLLRALLTTTPAVLRDYNRRASDVAQVRMRIVVHAGEVALDERGAIGGAVVEAFRLSASTELHEVLAQSAEPCVLCVSDDLYRGVVRHHHPGISPEHFHPLHVESKEGRRKGWVHDRSRLHDPAGSAKPEVSGTPPRTAPQPERVAPAGNYFAGSTHIAGDAVGGNKYVLGPEGARGNHE